MNSSYALVALSLLVVLGSLLYPRDDTDPASGRRSGMLLFTDNLTGCQYLSQPVFGGLTPRLDAAGKHVGCKSIDTTVNKP